MAKLIATCHVGDCHALIPSLIEDKRRRVVVLKYWFIRFDNWVRVSTLPGIVGILENCVCVCVCGDGRCAASPSPRVQLVSAR